MHNLTIETKRTVTCNFSADQWELFTMSFSRDEIEAVADLLNTSLQDYVNCDYTKSQTIKGMHKVMAENSKYGAHDSEPIRFLERVLEEIYK